MTRYPKGGVRLSHPTARGCQVTMTVPGGVLVDQPETKTYPVQVDGTGHAFVSYGVWDRLQRLAQWGYDMGFRFENHLDDPPALVVGGEPVTMRQQEVINNAIRDIMPAGVGVHIRS